MAHMRVKGTGSEYLNTWKEFKSADRHQNSFCKKKSRGQKAAIQQHKQNYKSWVGNVMIT